MGDAALDLVEELGRTGYGPAHPAAKALEEGVGGQAQLPLDHDARRELLGRALSPLEPADPGAGEPALPQLLVAVHLGQAAHRVNAAHFDEYPTEVEKDDADLARIHPCRA